MKRLKLMSVYKIKDNKKLHKNSTKSNKPCALHQCQILTEEYQY